jgi:hypothetical protein
VHFVREVQYPGKHFKEWRIENQREGRENKNDKLRIERASKITESCLETDSRSA